MASKRFVAGSDEFEMFKDFYKLVQDYYITEDTYEFWEQLLKDMNDFIRKYEHIRLACSLYTAFIDSKSEGNEMLNKYIKKQIEEYFNKLE